MELVYLWVEDYKNIQKQGFNFSPRFRCEYDAESKELEIIDKDETGEFYPKNFFGDNINVTAIVGENGSGKSSILEEFLNLGAQCLLVFRNTDFYINRKVGELQCNLEYKEGEKLLRDEKVIYLNSDVLKSANIIDRKSQSNSTTHSSNLNITDCVQGSNSEILDLNKFQQIIYEKILKIFKEKIDLKFNFIPIQIIMNFKEENMKEPSEEKKEFLKKLKDNHKNNGFIKERGFGIKDFIINYFDENKKLFFELFEEKAISVMLYDELGRNIFHLSNGERKLFIDTLFIYEKLKNIDDNTLILLDEPDLGIHPNWQKSYIKQLIKTFDNFGKKLHFVITTHSPFLLSDLPKQNVIFLEKDEKTGNCINATEKMKDFNTFGANIHTLLSHGFFMKDGLMGEFAKSKIDDVIKYLNNKETEIKNDEDAQNIINIIGEPIIKRELQRMLKNKMELSNKTEIDTIKDEIKLLTERLEKLEPKDEK
jgi:predicted ATP-binding protein involved in virulence